MYKHILVATDGSDLANKGVTQAIELAKELKAKITFVSVSEKLPNYGVIIAAEWATSPSMIKDYEERIKEETLAILERARSLALESDVTAQVVHIENDSAAAGILEAAKSENCDLIVIASHGRRGVTKLLLGSQAAEVLSLSQVPVLIVK